MITAGNRWRLFAMPPKRQVSIKHSFATAIRQARCRWDARIHRLGRKALPPPDKLPCGLIGAGSFFHYGYLPGLNRKNSPVAIAGVLTRSEQTAREARRALRYATREFSSIAAMREAAVNSVLILAPNHLHFDLARQAIETGLSVFCEKPLTNHVADALALKSRLKPNGPVLMVDFNQRHLDRNRVLTRLITENRIGRIETVQAYHNQNLTGQVELLPKLRQEITGGGVVHNAGIHFINLFLHWFGDVERVSAVFENRALPRECGEDTAFCRFWFRNGVTATLEASFANVVATSYESVRFVGDRGEITSDLKKGNIRCRLRGKRGANIPCRKEVISDSVGNALTEFARCVSTCARPETDVDDFIRTMKVVEALTLSAHRGAEVHLEELERKYA